MYSGLYRHVPSRGLGFLRGLSCVKAIEVVTRVPTSLLQTLGKRATLEVQRISPLKRRHPHFWEVSGFPSMQRFTAFLDCAENARSALFERVFFHEIGGVFTQPSQPKTGDIARLLSNFTRKLKYMLPHVTPIEPHAYVEATYRGRKLGIYRTACEKLLRRGLLRSDSYLGSFLKWEKIPLLNKRQVPRIIQPRSPAYNVELGRYLHPIEHTVYRAIDHVFGHTSVTKGMNAFQQGALFHEAWGQFEEPMALCIDASRFDQHISKAILQWEHGIYNYIYQNDSQLSRALKYQLNNRGFLRADDTVLKYTVEGGRCSGDMNTAMGNILVACAGVYSWLDSLDLVKKTRVLDAGDDCVIIGNRTDIVAASANLQEWFDQMGLIMKVEPLVSTLEKISFCQTNPVYDGHQWRMVRNPHMSLSKDCVVLHSSYLGDLRSYLNSIGNCGLSLTGGLPVLQNYYRAMLPRDGLQRTRDYEALINSGFFQLAKGMHEAYRPVTDEARVSFFRAFGITPDLQIELEKQFDSISPDFDCTAAAEEIVRNDLGIGS